MAWMKFGKFAALSLALVFAACGDDGSSAKITDDSKDADDPKDAEDVLDEFTDYLDGGDWSWDLSKDDYLNSKIKYGTMTDSRDKMVYKTVKIGGQTWMAENLNYADSAKTKSLLGKNRCYDDDAKKCKLVGRLYTWAAAIDSVKLATDSENPQNCGYGLPCFLPSRVQGICPKGWHLPSKEEWEILFDKVGGISEAGKALKSQKGWDSEYIHGNGSDKYGFSALPAGTYAPQGWYSLVGINSNFWSSTQYNTENVYAMSLISTQDEANLSEGSSSDNSYSYIRCLEDNGEAPSNPEPDYGTLTDARDGNVYKTVKIGEQTWMAENLNYADSVATESLLERSWCYDDESENCDKYGRLYTWAAAIDSVKLATDKKKPLDCGYGKACSLPSTVQGICPEGWHLPSEGEWYTLIDLVGGEDRAGMVLKSKSGWTENGDGSDAYGFSALPAGGYGGYFEEGSETYFWSSTPYHECRYEYDESVDDYVCIFGDDEYDYAYSIEFSSGGVSSDHAYASDRSKELGFSIRCIKDSDD